MIVDVLDLADDPTGMRVIGRRGAPISAPSEPDQRRR